MNADNSRTYVLVHGAFHGGWCWRYVAEALTAAGHRVFTPTQTGLGQARHLLSRAITLDTFILDIAGLIEAEELNDVTLVGHSLAGVVISGVADRMPERIRNLVFLDAVLVDGGQSPFGVFPAEIADGRRRLAAEQGLGLAVPPPAVSALGVPEDHPRADWLRRRLTPHPLGVYESTLTLRAPLGAGLPCTYIACTSPKYPVLDSSRRLARARPGWTWLEIATGHEPMVTEPEALARMLLRIG